MFAAFLLSDRDGELFCAPSHFRLTTLLGSTGILILQIRKLRHRGQKHV